MSAIYDLIFSLPVSVYTVLILSPVVFSSDGNAALYAAAILTLSAVALYHLKTKQRILLGGLAAAVVAGILLTGNGELILNNLWIIGVLFICIAGFVLVKISGYNRYVKPVMAATGILVSIVRMMMGIKEEKAAFCMLAIFLLAVLAEYIQKGWKKEGDTGIKEHVIFVFPFLLPAVIITGLVNIPAKPYDWHHIRDLAEGIRNGYEALLQVISPEDGWDGGDNMGFSEKAVLGGRVGGEPYRAMTVSADTAGDYRLYLSGKTFDTFDGKKWVKNDNTDMNYDAYDIIETTAAILQHDENRIDDYLKSGRIRVRYEGLRTRYMFTPPKAVIEKSKETDIAGGDVRMSRGRKGDYTLKYYRLNRDDRGFIDIVKSKTPVDEDGWRSALLYNTSFSSEHMTYNDYRIYREKIHGIYGQNVILSERCKKFMDGLLEGADSDYDRLERIEKLLSSFEYSTSPGDLPETVRSEADFADYFILEKKEGYCTHFATAFVILARSCGIPARYVQGYSVLSRAAGFEVLSDRTHAWPEAYIDGVGWLIFEPTPGYRKVMGWEIPKGSQSFSGAREETAAEEKDREEVKEEAGDEEEKASRLWIRLSFIIFAVFLVLFIITDRIVRRIRYRSMEDREKVIMLCRKNMRMLRLAGIRPGYGETLAELRNRAGASVSEDVLGFIDLYERALYAPELSSGSIVEQAEEFTKNCSAYVRKKLVRSLKNRT
ncbi:MAG: hypothetical protein IKQ40_03240 [Lachnospiraceae bacterium]|nr:hypothetical protein [Lachnospiraceae bacterium]